MEKKIKRYIELLKAYNEKVNIYSQKAYDKLAFHIQDSINVAELIGNEKIRVLDVGSGAGFPAVIIAIVNNLNIVTAVEARGRKCRFLALIKEELALDNFIIKNIDVNILTKTETKEVRFFTAKAFAKPDHALKVIQKIAPEEAELIIPVSEKQQKEVLARSGIKFEHMDKNGFSFCYLRKRFKDV